MSIAAESALRAWVNARGDLVGNGNPLSRGAYLLHQRSPADGSYAVLTRTPEQPDSPVAEDNQVARARLMAQVYGGTTDTAETAAAALRSAWEDLQGCPQRVPNTNVIILVADGHVGPVWVPMPPDSGELYCFSVEAEFVMCEDES